MDAREQWRQVEPLFDRALDLRGPERDQFLARVLERSPQLARKLLQLLDAAEGAGEVIIDRSLDQVAGDLIEMIPEERYSGLTVGDEIDGYRILRLLGAGGSAQVFLARHKEQTSDVALKLLMMRPEDQRVDERFDLEQRVLRELDHPAAARFLDSGIGEHGRRYFTMRFIDGPPVTEYCDRHQLGCVDRLQVFHRICEVLKLTHARGVIHRDLKPSNILVERVGGEARPCLVDFGIALTPTPMDLTITGQIIGTPGYMSPEQARGDSRRVDQRSDIFSLGVVLFELLSGTTPFGRSSPIETVLAVIGEQPPRLDSVVPSIPADVSSLVNRCLAKDPEDRYPDLLDLMGDLSRNAARSS